MITKFTASSISNKINYDSMLAGNPAYNPPVFDLIQTVSSTNGGVSVTFSSIPQTYRHLQLRVVARTDDALLNLVFNGDTGANYVNHQLVGNGSAVSTATQSARNAMGIGVMGNKGATPTQAFGVSAVDILNYTSTIANKTARGLGGSLGSSATIVNLRSGLWLNTSAITSITILAAYTGGTFDASANRFSLYGIAG